MSREIICSPCKGMHSYRTFIGPKEHKIISVLWFRVRHRSCPANIRVSRLGCIALWRL